MKPYSGIRWVSILLAKPLTFGRNQIEAAKQKMLKRAKRSAAKEDLLRIDVAPVSQKAWDELRAEGALKMIKREPNGNRYKAKPMD